MENVIIPRLINGLGNRMFIFASAFGIAKRWNKRLVVANYEMKECSHITTDYDYFFGSPVSDPLYFAYFITDSYMGEKIGPHNYILTGYFQTNFLWKKYEDELRDLWKCPEEIRVALNEKYDPSNSVFLHIRRGDKVGTRYEVDLDIYYEECLKRAQTNRVLVISDDLKWCKKYPILKSYECIYIQENEVICMHLMSICTKGICSNSTFSWWGGFIGGGDIWFPSLLEYNLPIYKSMVPDNFIIIDVNTGYEIKVEWDRFPIL